MSPDSRLRIAIVGSGLAGLAAARVLREHHTVTVYERGTAATATGGQGTIATPNSVKILAPLGFDHGRVRSVQCTGHRSFDKSGKMLSDMEIDLKARYGGDWFMHLRSDYRDELLRLAAAPSEELGIGGEPARIVFETAVTSIDAEAGTFVLSDGTAGKSDVIVVADGIHSYLRHHILDDNRAHRAQLTGLSCFRFAVSRSDALAALGGSRLPEYFDPHRGDGRFNLIEANDGTNRVMAVYPCRDYEFVNVTCVFETRASKEDTVASWWAEGDRDEMVEIFRDFPEDVVQLLRTAKQVNLWELQDLEPLPTWTKGRACLMGDAAHAMTPLQGQGANMAVEDADGLRLLCEPGVTRADVPRILERWESVRKPRTTAVLHGTRSVSKASSGERWKNMDFNYGYNGIYEALKEVEGKGGDESRICA